MRATLLALLSAMPLSADVGVINAPKCDLSPGTTYNAPGTLRLVCGQPYTCSGPAVYFVDKGKNTLYVAGQCNLDTIFKDGFELKNDNDDQ